MLLLLLLPLPCLSFFKKSHNFKHGQRHTSRHCFGINSVWDLLSFVWFTNRFKIDYLFLLKYKWQLHRFETRFDYLKRKPRGLLSKVQSANCWNILWKYFLRALQIFDSYFPNNFLTCTNFYNFAQFLCYLYFLLITHPTACPQLNRVFFCLEFSFPRPNSNCEITKKYIIATAKAEWKFLPISEVSRAGQLQLRNAIIKKQQAALPSESWMGVPLKILPEKCKCAPHLYIYLTLSFPHSAISFTQWLLHLWDKFLLSTTIKLHFRVYGLRLPTWSMGHGLVVESLLSPNFNKF